ncbi:MAG: stage V sporulation protein AC [Oscillospiraceae bacterium]|nr:stage V sporulation protein AC [Oscillospiraceae bacterium]
MKKRCLSVTNQEYAKLVKEKSPNSKLGKNLCKAFVIGGLICCVGQLIGDGCAMLQLDTETGKTVTSVVMVFLGTLLTGLGVYDKLAKHAGAGTLVPITGFANSVAAPAIDFKSEGLITGLGAKMFIIAGPVLVYGTAASVVYGVIYLLLGGG